MTQIDIATLVTDRETGTQGPWYVVDMRGFKTDAARFENGAFGVFSDDCDYHAVADCSCNASCRNEDECHANARRIARVPDMESALIAQTETIARLTEALTLTVRAESLREVYHKMPNDRNRIGEKRSPKSHARDAWLRAFRKAAKNARAALEATK